jgi:hypothetical protein
MMPPTSAAVAAASANLSGWNPSMQVGLADYSYTRFLIKCWQLEGHLIVVVVLLYTLVS